MDNTSLVSYVWVYMDVDGFIEGSELRVAWMNLSTNGLSLPVGVLEPGVP